MADLAVDTIGYAAAIVTNISIYPQAYEVWIIVMSGEVEKLGSLSMTMFVLQTTGCFMWLLYACLRGLYPVMFGTVLCIIPSGYIIYCIQVYRQPAEIKAVQEVATDTSEIIIASGSVYAGDASSGEY